MHSFKFASEWLAFGVVVNKFFPGVSVRLIGGHTMAIQAVRVMTRRG